MFIGRGFDLNNDGTNEFFAGTHLSKEDRQAAGKVVGGLLLAGVVGYALLAILAVLLAAILFPLWSFVISPLYDRLRLSEADVSQLSRNLLLTSAGVIALVPALWFIAAAIRRVRRARRRFAKKAARADAPVKQQGEGFRTGEKATRNLPVGNVHGHQESTYWVRRGHLCRGPVTAATIRAAIASAKLCERDEWSSGPNGPWQRLEAFASNPKGS